MSVRFRFGWVDAGPSPDILAQATMATLSVEAGGTTVTSVLDRGNRIYSNEVVVPLFGVAEWLVTNWWHIWYEIEDTGGQGPEFPRLHHGAQRPIRHTASDRARPRRLPRTLHAAAQPAQLFVH